MQQRLPLFVYGTLVPKHGFANFQKVLGGRVDLFAPNTDLSTKTDSDYTKAFASPFKIYHLQGFPGCKKSNESTDVVTGALVWPRGTDDDYQATILEADRLEKFSGKIGDPSNQYERIELDTTTEDGEIVKAYIYECLLDTSGAEQVKHGNWPLYMRENSLKDAADNWSELNKEAQENKDI
jgi:gamma-glutamylcyclotransferase (GGCT)/AIG2-like uncharacterized protein YtfP